jgi:hypothetical protein
VAAVNAWSLWELIMHVTSVRREKRENNDILRRMALPTLSTELKTEAAGEAGHRSVTVNNPLRTKTCDRLK